MKIPMVDVWSVVLTQKRFQLAIGDGEVAFFSTKRLDRRNRADLIESVTPCHGVQVVGSLTGY